MGKILKFFLYLIFIPLGFLYFFAKAEWKCINKRGEFMKEVNKLIEVKKEKIEIDFDLDKYI